LTAVRGNPHNVAGVKNKKLFERKARVIFCLARKLYAGRTGRHSRKSVFAFNPISCFSRLGIVRTSSALLSLLKTVFCGFGQKKRKKL
jgi:hypothetical protein